MIASLTVMFSVAEEEQIKICAAGAGSIKNAGPARPHGLCLLLSYRLSCSSLTMRRLRRNSELAANSHRESARTDAHSSLLEVNDLGGYEGSHVVKQSAGTSSVMTLEG